MEKKNEEKPTLYFITGHRAAGKTSKIADLLPDHPFIPMVDQYNEKMRVVWDNYQSDKDLRNYVVGADREMDATENYIKNQLANKENIYIEVDCGVRFNLKHFEQQTNNQYNTHIIFVLCDNLQQSVDRMAVKNNCEQRQLDLTEITNDYHAVNRFLNKSGNNTKDRIDIYSGGEEKPKLLATIDKGKIITAAPELMTKIWLDPGGPLGRKIGNYTIEKKQAETKDQVQKQGTHPAQILKQRRDRKKRLGI